MPQVQLTLSVQVDGEDVPELSLVRRLQVGNALTFADDRPSSNTPANLSGIDVLNVLNALLIRATDQTVIVNLTDAGGGKTPTPVTLNPGGVLLIFDAIVPVGQNASPEIIQIVQNSGSRSTVKGLVAGAAA